MKIGFFGGSFNPPTNAHINLAKEVLNICKLDKIVFMPMGDCYKKPGLAKAVDRIKMLEIAFLNCKCENFEISDLEVKQERSLNAIDAFRLIEKEFPNDDRYFIMGADNFIKIANWEESKNLIEEYKYIVLERGDINLKKYIDTQKFKDVKIIKNNKYKEYSSTEFRKLIKERIIKNQDIIIKEILEFIIKKGIY